MAQLIPVDHDPFDMAASLAAAGGGDPLVPPPRNPAMPADWAQNAVRRVGGGLADILMAPRRAMDQGMTTEEAVPWASNAALTLAGTGAPAAVRGAAGIFGGRLAKTADQAALSKAEELAKTGAPREQIWNDTGWFQGGDGKWRFEIPDDRSILRFGRLEDARQSNKTPEIPTGDALNHSQLFAAYPQMATETATAIRDLGPNQRGVFIKSDPLTEGPSMISLSKDYPAVEQHSSLLHELQHAIQSREGFVPGANPQSTEIKALASEQFRKAMSSPAGARYSELEAKRNVIPRVSLTPAEQDEMMKIYRDHFDMYKLQRDAYLKNAGEVEARNVQSRMNMTPEERRAKPPWLTEDVPAGQQIFGPASGGVQYQLIPVDHDPFNVGSGAIIPPKQGIRAYHASPHDFERFDLSKIGTGEGAQSYGHGLYFAENPAVSGQGGQYWNAFMRNFGNTPEWEAANLLRNNKFDRSAAVKEADRLARHYDDKHTRDMLELLKSEKPVGPRTYEVNINAKPEQFLDWDRPLAQQPPEIGKTLSGIPHPVVKAWTENGAFPHVSGHSFYDTLASRGSTGGMAAGNPMGREAATSILREAGIPGIKYLDQGSRNLQTSPEAIAELQASIAKKEAAHAADPWLIDPKNNAWGSRNLEALEEQKRQLTQIMGGPTSNYVVFDDKIIDILHKYGIGGLSMLPPAVAAHIQSRLIPVDHDPFAQ